jgi:hypothetical protein
MNNKKVKDDIFNTDVAKVFYISGKRNSGKTYFTLQMLINKHLLKNKFDEIFVINPTLHYDNKWKLLDIPEENIYGEFSLDLLETLDNYFQETYTENPDKNFLLILDDCLGSKEFKKTNGSIFDKMIYIGRHYNLNMIILSQKYKGISTGIRSNIDYFITFDTYNEMEKKTIFEEMGIGTKKDFYKIWDYVFTKKHDKMIIDTANGFFYRNFNKLSINFEKN